MHFETVNEDGNTYPAIHYYFHFPNPKYYNIDLSNVYILYHSSKHGLLDIDNAKISIKFTDNLSSYNANRINSSTDERIDYSWTVYSSVENPDYNSTKYFRLAYKYEEDGQTKYAYSSVFEASYNELKKS